MAEAAVKLVVDNLIPLLRDEFNLLRGVHGEITLIKDQLELIKAYLKDADEKAERPDTDFFVKEWVKQVREVAFRIQDVIDEYLFKVKKRHQKHGLAGAVSKTGHFIKTIIPRHEITSQINDLKKSLVRLNEARETFGFNPSVIESSSRIEAEVSTRHNLRQGARFMDDADLIGVDKTKEKLIGYLSHGERRRTIISVVGEGGLGKTTIVNNLYKNQKEKKSFDCYAWITVSHLLKAGKLLKTMLQIFYEYDGNKQGAMELVEMMDQDQGALTSKLREYLQGKRYLIVFDDLWDEEFWGGVEYGLPEENNSSRVMITTRNQGVVDFCKRFAPVYFHELEPLLPEDALKLFHIKAFQFHDAEGCPEELLELSQNFVNKCNGVPFVIVAIAGLLSTKKKSISDWKRIFNSLHSKLTSDPHLNAYYQVLSESYNDLSYQLKLCLLYFGLFPEGYSIGRQRLINLWITEGFVMQNASGDETNLEEVGEEYLNELIRRSLVKISMLYPYGRVRRCRVHDLMYHFILKKCEEINFCQVMKCQGFRLHTLTRRLSVQTDNIDDLKSTTTYGKVRSCFVFTFKGLSKPVVESMLSSFKLLIGLDMEDAPIDYLPEAVGNLLLLKYLSLQNTKIMIIPKFIGKLQNLESLNLKYTLVRELPIEINNLVKLRCLVANFPRPRFQGVKLKGGIGCLRALEKLSMFDATDGDAAISELKNLKHMRSLFIIRLSRHQGKLLCCSIESMNRLSALGIEGANEHEVVDLESLNDPPQNLQRLYLDARLENLPNWFVKLKNLVKLRLRWSGLMEDPLLVLKGLSELAELRFEKSYEGEELNFKYGWFRKLKHLELIRMQGLRYLKIDKGALPFLEILLLQDCSHLVEVPTDIQNLETLKEFHLAEMPPELLSNLLLKTGENCKKIKEITIVTSSSDGVYRQKLNFTE